MTLGDLTNQGTAAAQCHKCKSDLLTLHMSNKDECVYVVCARPSCREVVTLLEFMLEGSLILHRHIEELKLKAPRTD